MDMQNVSNLQIPEGAVRTIHDKDNRLIWGRLAYDTKYAGDTYQQTYSGKNLFDISSFEMGTIDGVTIDPTCKFRIQNGDNPIAVQPNTAYTISAILSNQVKGYRIGVHLCDSNKGFISDLGWKQLSTSSFTFTTPSNCYYVMLIGSLSTTSDTVGTSTTEDKTTFDDPTAFQRGCVLQFELGSQPTSYEPYTGGIPAPNPDYPQQIQVVTGEQIISITDGTNTQNFTVNLGATELCKIGTSQDYIYPSNGDWYVRKDIGKVTINGSYGGYNGTFNWYYCTAAQYGGESPSSSAVCVGNLFRYIPFVTFKPNTSLIGMSVENGGFRLRNTACSSASDYQTWLSNNNLILYYQLATPTDTKITDATLIEELNAVHEWLTRYGYSSTVTGNLPIIIDRTNL